MDRGLIEARILELATYGRVFTTNHVARWFEDYSRPNQKALEYIQPLVDSRILETKSKVTRKLRGFEPEVFRLTKKGRELQKIDFHPIPFTDTRLKHWFLIADTYLDMCDIQKPKLFIPEQRLNDNKFHPDIFAIWQKRAMWIEVQPSKLSSSEWEKKWQSYKDYIETGLYRQEMWQDPTAIRQPRVVAISTQLPETVQSGIGPPILKFDHVENIKALYIAPVQQ